MLLHEVFHRKVGLLLRITTEGGIIGGEELLGIRLQDIPRRIADSGVKATVFLVEDVGELQGPMEEVMPPRKDFHLIIQFHFGDRCRG
ncbi:MAG: hypothetical protein Q7I93_04680, partial [Syntrophales bacterium]|nr:hypothetical protein [Syntrophales bacterium]